MVLISELTTAEFAHLISLWKTHSSGASRVAAREDVRGGAAGRGVFESLLMDTFRVWPKERMDTKRGKTLYGVSDDGSPVLATSFIHLDLLGKTVSLAHIR